MGIFHRDKRKGLVNKGKDLSELQGVPYGTFRCDVCKFVWPKVCLCGAIVDAADKPPKVCALCGVCAIWLGFGEYHFPQGLCVNLTEEQREKIEALHRELDIRSKELGETAETSREKLLANNVEGGLGLVHDFLENIPNLREFLRLRLSLSPRNILDLSDRLSRGEFVAPSEIEKVDKG